MSNANVNRAADKSLLIGDLWGGFAAMLVALPSSIAFGISIYIILGPGYIGHGVMAGIIGAIALGMVASLIGGAPRLITTPCAPAAAVMSAVALEFVKSAKLPPSQVVALLVLVGVLAGILQLVYAGIGGGKLIKYIPYPVVSGYLSGVGMLIVLSQVPKFLGAPKNDNLWETLAAPSLWNWPGVLVGLATIAGMLLGHRVTRKVPATIIGLLAGLAAYFMQAIFLPELRTLRQNELLIGPLFEAETSIVANFIDRWHSISSLRLSDLSAIIMPALTLSVLLSIDTLKSCIVLDTLTRSRHRSSRTLTSQGIGNVLSAVLGGMPGAGAIGPTLVNLNSGGKTGRSGVLEGIFVVVAVLLLGGFIGWIPIAALAGILIVIGARMVDWHSFHLLRQKATIFDFGVIASVVGVAMKFDLITATGTGLGLAILLFIRDQTRGTVVRRKVYAGQISSKQYRLAEEKELLHQYGTLCTVCELQGSLFFGTTDKLFSELEADLKLSRYVILDLQRVQSVDFTAAHMLEQIASILTDRGGFLLFTSLPSHLPTGQDLQAYFRQVGVMSSSLNVKTFPSLDEALECAEDLILDEHRQMAKGRELALELPEIELLREFETDHTLPALKKCVRECSFKPGEFIFKKGDPGDELFLIRRGIVRIVMPMEDGRRLALATFARGNFFGEIAFLDRGQRSADASADQPTDLYAISRQRFDELSSQHPVLGVKLFARLARGLAIRLRYADKELRALKEA